VVILLHIQIVNTHWIPQLFVLFASSITFYFEVNPIRELISQ
jgi:hypothetical protein